MFRVARSAYPVNIVTLFPVRIFTDMGQHGSCRKPAGVIERCAWPATATYGGVPHHEQFTWADRRLHCARLSAQVNCSWCGTPP